MHELTGPAGCPMTSSDYASMFNQLYYREGCGRPYQRDEVWLNFFDGIAEKIVREINPRTVLDVGCAMGFLVEGLRKRGVEAYGVDISEYAISQVHESIRPYVRVGSAAEPFPQRYDLIVTIEVLEHMPKEDAEKAILNFTRHADDVLFSSTPFDYKEATHFNVQVPEYWLEQFARQQFYHDLDFDASFITQWAFRVRKNSEPIHHLIREYERKFFMLWKECTDLRALATETRAELDALKAKGEQDQQRLEAAAQKLQALENESAALQAEAQALGSQNVDLQTRVQTLDGEKADLQADVQNWKKSWDALVNSRGWRILERARKIMKAFHLSGSNK